MDHVNVQPVDCEARRSGQVFGPGTTVDVAAYCRQGRYAGESVEMRWIADVSCMQDVADALQSFQRFGSEQAVSIGDDADNLFRSWRA